MEPIKLEEADEEEEEEEEEEERNVRCTPPVADFFDVVLSTQGEGEGEGVGFFFLASFSSFL